MGPQFWPLRPQFGTVVKCGWLPECRGRYFRAAGGTPIIASCRTVTNPPPGICSPLPQQLGPQMPNLHSQRHLPFNHRFCDQRGLLISAHELQQSRPPGATAAASEEPFHYPLPAPRLTAVCCCWTGPTWTTSDPGTNMPHARLPKLCPRPHPGICGSGDSRPPSFFCAASFSHPMRPT